MYKIETENYHLFNLNKDFEDLNKQLKDTKQQLSIRDNLDYQKLPCPTFSIKEYVHYSGKVINPFFNYSYELKYNVLYSRYTVDQVKQWIEAAKNYNTEVFKVNQENRNKAEALLKLIKDLSALSSVEPHITSRGNVKGTQTAGWIISINKHYAAYPIINVEETEKNLKQHEERIEKEKQDKLNRQKERESELKLQELLANFIKKYAIPASDIVGKDIQELKDFFIDYLLKKNKYLNLAYWLEKNRGDWSDGPSYAEVGLQGFSIQSPTDREIVDEIQGMISDWDGDGRCFRDCKWNYGELYSLVDTSLLEDFNALIEYDDSNI